MGAGGIGGVSPRKKTLFIQAEAALSCFNAAFFDGFGEKLRFREEIMDGKLRNMTSVYLRDGERVLLLYRQGGRVVNDVWTSSAGGHFESFELNDARACVLRELNEELGLCESDIENLSLRYITLRRTKGEIRQNYFFFADIKSAVSRDLTSNEGITKWFSLDETAALEMPYSAKFKEKGGIMGVGSDKVTLEFQRYGRNKDTLVNKTYIESGDYKFGIIVCHNGKVFKYSSEKRVNEHLYELYIRSGINQGLPEYDAQIKALEKFRQSHRIDFMEVK